MPLNGGKFVHILPGELPSDSPDSLLFKESGRVINVFRQRDLLFCVGEAAIKHVVSPRGPGVYFSDTERLAFRRSLHLGSIDMLRMLEQSPG